MMEPKDELMNKSIFVVGAALAVCLSSQAWAQGVRSANPDEFIKSAIETVVKAAKADPAAKSGDINATVKVVEREFLPYTDFARTARLAVGEPWKSATPEQQSEVVKQFQTLLVRTYALQLTQIRDQQVSFRFEPSQPVAKSTDRVVQSEVLGSGDDSLKVGYRLEKTSEGWRIYDIDMMGSWAIGLYSRQFANALKTGGMDGLIKYLTDHNARLR